MRPRCRCLQLIVSACAVVAVAQPTQAAMVSFYDSLWDHGSGPQAGWSDGATSGTTSVGGVNVTVTSSAVGGSTPVNGMHMSNIDDAPNFVGFGLVQDPSEANNSGSLSNYLRLDVAFSRAVILDPVAITDIDRTMPFFGLVDVAGYWDVVAVEGFVGGLGAVGTGLAAQYSLTGNDLEQISRYGLSALRAESGGNGQQDPANQAEFDFGATEIRAFSLYYWNNGTTTDAAPRQIIGVGDVHFQVAQTPEPASLACCLLGALMLGGVRLIGRRRRARQESCVSWPKLPASVV